VRICRGGDTAGATAVSVSLDERVSVRAERRAMVVAAGPPKKPHEGAVCNGCGLCCAVQLCPLAIEFIPDAAAPCPAMEFAEGRFWCGLARRPSRYLDTPASGDRLIRGMVFTALSIGEGCDASD
jgi:hypothetical protein